MENMLCDDILTTIFLYLPPEDVRACYATCRDWRDNIKQNCILNVAQYCKDDVSILKYALRNGNVKMGIFKWFLEIRNIDWSGSTFSDNTTIMDRAAGYGHLELIKWMHKKGYRCTNRAMNLAAGYGHLEVVKWLYENRTDGRINCAFDWAARNGRLDVLKFLNPIIGRRSYRYYNMGRYSAMDWAIIEGHLETVEWLCENIDRSRELFSGSANIAAKNNQIKILECLRKHNFIFKNIDMRMVIENGHLDVLKWLHANKIKGCLSRENIAYAARYGNCEIAIWLNNNLRGKGTDNAMYWAAREGHLNILKYLDSFTTSKCGKCVMDEAAKNGHLNIVTWLHWSRDERCTRLAMTYAAGNGHLDIVKFLHDHRNEGCSKSAMDLASKNGHFKMVRWLHFNRIEGCSTNALYDAIKNGHLEIVKFLYTNRTEGCTKHAIKLAKENGHHELALWLYENGNNKGCEVRKRLIEYNSVWEQSKRIKK